MVLHLGVQKGSGARRRRVGFGNHWVDREKISFVSVRLRELVLVRVTCCKSQNHRVDSADVARACPRAKSSRAGQLRGTYLELCGSGELLTLLLTSSKGSQTVTQRAAVVCAMPMTQQQVCARG